MVDLSLHRSVQELSRYFKLFSLEELVDESLKKDSAFISSQASLDSDPEMNIESGGSKSALIAKLHSLVVETQRGSLLSKDLVSELNQIANQLEQFDDLNKDEILQATVIPYFDGSISELPSISQILASPEIDTEEGINRDPQNPTKENPTISVFQIQNVRINPSNKNTNAVSIFMNAIPTYELNRAIPFLNVKFQLARPRISDGRISSLSLIKFLEGAKPFNELGAADKVLASVQSSADNEANPEATIKENISRGSSGIEIFTSPQSLINADTNNEIEFRAAPVIDIFRPFASLQSFTVEVVPAPGIMSYRTAKLSFIIHDSSRLHEFADFIKPDQFNTAEILVEYGWSHPDSNSVFGDFINALRVREKYMVKNNSFAFKGNREVNVTLDLYTKGSSEIYTNTVSTDSSVVKTQEEIQRLQERIATFRNKVFKQSDRYVKEIRGAQILSSASDGNSELKLSRELKIELRKALSSLGSKGSGDDAKELRKALIDLYGKDGENGAAKDLKQSIASAIQRKINRIKGDTKTPDPFVYVDLPPSQKKPDLIKQKSTDKDYVSLAKIFLMFLAEPLAATNRFDDIQLLFYTFNDGAGKIHGKNVGSFLIDIEVFKQRYQRVTTSRRSADLNLRDFADFITNSFVDDISSINYGMRELYDYEPDKESGSRIKVKKKYKDATILNRTIEKLMKEAGVSDGVFKMPMLDIYVEAVPAVPVEQVLEQEELDAKTILRIHVYDKVASAYSTQGELLASAQDTNISTLGDVPLVDTDTPATTEQKNDAQALIQRAVSRNLIEQLPGTEGKDKVYRIKGGLLQLKEFISNTMPTISIGVNNTAVIDGGLKSMTDDRLSTINMIRSGDAGPLSPNGVGHGGIPMQLLPAQMELQCIGCPIVEYAQSFFVDYKTNTSIDNIYVVTGIEHSFNGQASFKTNLKLTPLDAYGQYRSLTQKIGAAIKILGEFTEEE